MSERNVAAAEIERILEYAQTVAVVGASIKPEKPAHAVPLQLQAAGFRVIPVNPAEEELFGERAYPSLEAIPDRVDVVQVFRPSAEAPDLAVQAVRIGARALWLQLGIESAAAREIAAGGGLDYVQDRCMGVEQRRLGIVKR